MRKLQHHSLLIKSTLITFSLTVLTLFKPLAAKAEPEIKHGKMPVDSKIIQFFSSSSSFDNKLNSFYQDMLKGKVNGEAANDDAYTNVRIFDPSWSLWRQWQAMSTSFLKESEIREANKVFLQNIKVANDGFVYNGYSEDEIGWIFPTYHDSRGKARGWEFNQPGNLEGWIPDKMDSYAVGDIGSGNTGLTTTATQNYASLRVESLNIDSYNCPIIRLRVSSQHDDNNLALYWKTNVNLEWSEDKKLEITINNDGGWHTYNLLAYKNPQWRNQITGFSLYLPKKSGATRQGFNPYAGVDFIRCAYDTRQSIVNTAYILGAWKYYLWTKDENFLGSMMPKLRKVSHFLQTEFQGNSLGYLQNSWPGHDGTSGLASLSPRQERVGYGIGSNWHDLLPFGGKDGYLSSYYLQALQAMSDLEKEAPRIGLGSNPYGETADSFQQKAEIVKQTAGSFFWNNTAKRFFVVKDANDNQIDYGYTFANLEMLYNGLGDNNKAQTIFDWLDGSRTVAGDTVAGTDIYLPRFAPRLSTKRNETWYMWNTTIRNWGQQIQDGGAALYYSFYDVMDRIKYKGADNAFTRFADIVNWWQDVKNAGGVRTYYESGPGSNILKSFWRLQGGGVDGGIGLDNEFPENVIVPTAFLYGFLGVSPQVDGLHIKPKLPSSLSYAGVERLYHWGKTYKIRVDKNTSIATISNPSADSFEVVVPNGQETIIADGQIIAGQTIDIFTLLSKWGSNDSQADLNSDGRVNGLDFVEMIKAAGSE